MLWRKVPHKPTGCHSDSTRKDGLGNSCSSLSPFQQYKNIPDCTRNPGARVCMQLHHSSTRAITLKWLQILGEQVFD